MSLVALDVYAEDAPNGTLLGTLDETDLVSLRIDFQHRGLDWFEASIRRDSAKASLVAADRYLKLRIPMVQATPLAGMWASGLLYHLSSRRERGGELLKFGGPGALWILRLARLLHTWHAPGQTARGSANKAPNLWWWINEPYGAIALRAIQEGQYQLAAGSILAPLNGVTTDFTRTVDSAGVAWTNIAGEFETRVGTDVLALEAELQEAGNFYLEAEPNLLIHAWQTYPGRDLTASVHLQRAVNIASELARELKARHAFTHLVLEDSEGSYSTEALAGFTAGRAHVGYHHAPQTSDDALLNRIGQDVLRASRSALQAAAVDVKPGALLPGKGAGQVWKGDTVLLSSIAPGGVAGPQDYNATPVLVTGIRLTLADAVDDSTLTTRQRSLRMVLSFNEEHRLAGPSLPSVPGAGGPNASSHTHLDHLCRPAAPGGDLLAGISGLGDGSTVLDHSNNAGAGWPSSITDGTPKVALVTVPNLPGPEAGNWWSVAFPAARSIRAFAITSDPWGNNGPTDIAVQSSDDNVTWTTRWQWSVHGPAPTLMTDGSGWAIAPGTDHYDWGIKDLPGGPITARYWRFRSMANSGGGNPWFVGGLSLYATGTPADLPQPVGSVAAVGTSIRQTRCDHAHAHGVITTGDHHTEYQREVEKGAASGYAALDAGTKVPTAQLGGAGADSTKFLRGDQAWAAPPAPTAAQVRDAGRWEPLTNGSTTSPELVFMNGDVIMMWRT